MQLDLFAAADLAQLQEEVFQAYFECRRNKRNSSSALAFERTFERELFALADRLFDGSWRPGPSVAFIVEQPVKREVFAASFADRVVHHWLMMKLTPHFEALFVEGSFACRPGKGTLFGIRQLEAAVRKESVGNNRGSFVLKLDIQGFFMSIPRQRLWDRLEAFIRCRYKENDSPRVLAVAKVIALLDATQGCRIAGARRDWEGLPSDKSLFTTAPGCGLPIGNLTSQVFANFYLHALDDFIIEQIPCSGYGRYVDDFFLVSDSPRVLRDAAGQIAAYLREDLGLRLHPKRRWLQHASKGVAFLGAVVWPTHTTIGKRLKRNFYAAIEALKESEDLPAARQRLNSYLGIMCHHRSHRLRRQGLRVRLCPDVRAQLVIPRDCRRVRVRA